MRDRLKLRHDHSATLIKALGKKLGGQLIRGLAQNYKKSAKVFNINYADFRISQCGMLNVIL
jgi:hypothetical protein